MTDDLGLNRSIPRRDFLQGSLIGLGGCMLSGCPSSWPGPDASLARSAGDFAGQTESARLLGHQVRDRQVRLSDAVASGEHYDLVVVGAGLSGLTAAYHYRKLLGSGARVLLVDGQSEFGGHARRNTFTLPNGQPFYEAGGTYAVEHYGETPQEVLALFSELGVTEPVLRGLRDADFRQRFGLSQGMFFDSRIVGGRDFWKTGVSQTPKLKFFDDKRLSEAVRQELLRLYDTMPRQLSEKELVQRSWGDYLSKDRGFSEISHHFANLDCAIFFGLGCDAIAAHFGHSIEGAGFRRTAESYLESYSPLRFPDGNHTLARSLLKKLIPDAISGSSDIASLVSASLSPERFDHPDNTVRLRLNTMVADARHTGKDQVEIVCMSHGHSRPVRLSANHLIMTGWGPVTRRIIPELPTEQTEALKHYNQASLLYINLLLRNWRPMAEIGVDQMLWPGGYGTWMQISDPVRIGQYQPEYHPDQPIGFRIHKVLTKPGRPAREQLSLNRMELERQSFQDIEKEVRSEMNRLFGSHGFDARRDILALHVNRWAHGYAFFHDPQPSGKLNESFQIGRRQLGRISFAGSDAGGRANTQNAMIQGLRAAQEQVAMRSR